ncbi:MAG: Fic family protein [Acidobacteriota bacterium]
MRHLPIYPARSEDGGMALARRRDLLARRAEANPRAARRASDALVVDCVWETLRLTGVSVSRENVEQVAAGGVFGADAGQRGRMDPFIGLIRGQLDALNLIEREAREHPSLSLSFLQEVHRLSSPPSDGAFRRGPVKPQFQRAAPCRPELISDKVSNLLDWLSVASGRAMYPPERSALAFVRLLEISPFARGNFRCAHLLLNFFAFVESYPPFFLRFEESEEVRKDIEQALVFDTFPLVSRLSQALARSLSFCLDASEQTGGRDADPAPPEDG